MTTLRSTYGIIGYPVKHSLSPVMHNTAFKELGLDAEYKLFNLKENEIDDFFADLRSPDSPIFGLNVTVPYKEKAVLYLDHLSPFVKQAMAVNTIVINQKRELSGYNTDGPGFLAHLSELSFDIENTQVSILGAGGTTRAILTALCLLPKRPKSILIYNRTIGHAQDLLKDLSERIDTSLIKIVPAIDDLNIEVADLLINTTSVGLNKDDPCLIDSELLHSDLLVYDVIYQSEGTPLLRMAEERGVRTANGLGMLFYQGVLSFQHWSEVELDPEIKNKMRQSLEMGKV